MYFTKWQDLKTSVTQQRAQFAAMVFAMVFAMPFLTACKLGVTGGTVEETFSGVQSAKAISPTEVVLNWTLSEEFGSYEIYSDKSTTTETTSFDTITIKGLQPDTTYKFKVIGKNGSNSAGGETELVVTTWSRFTGVSSEITKDEDQNLKVEWSYNFPALEYHVFYQPDTPPTAETTENWTKPNLVTSEKIKTFKDLIGSRRYYFVVHARYNKDMYERPDVVASAMTKSAFQAPVITLAKVTIGSLPSITITPQATETIKTPFFTSVVYQDGKTASDPLVGAGTATFFPSSTLRLGKIDNISVKIRYKDDKLDETMTVEGLSTYLKGVTDFLDVPPISTLGAGAAYLGESTAVGDFNCDGADDLAIGMPRASIASEGVRAPNAGAVYVYYSYLNTTVGKLVLKTPQLVPGLVPKRSPVKPGEDPQLITFADLTDNARFGMSMSVGNLNGDVRGEYDCDDLIVGAPELDNPNGNNNDGSAFVFFGSNTGLNSPNLVSSFYNNTKTCDGRAEGAVCNAVRLWPNYALWPSAIVGSYQQTEINSAVRFGSAVSFIGDFNADGYQDIAIGAPYGDWHGKPTSSGTTEFRIDDVGFVAIYFGSAYGISKEPIKEGAVTHEWTWLKIYPPIVQKDMFFGSSIAGGVDVDGGYRVRANGKFHGGADMVVGAPGFAYSNPAVLLAKTKNSAIGGPFKHDETAGSEYFSTYPEENGWWSVTTLPPSTPASGSQTFGVNYFPGVSLTSPMGTAFLYFGRSESSQYDVVASGAAGQDEPERKTFWNCGKRNMTSNSVHYSCLADPGSFRILFPRSGDSRNFGAAVALLGEASTRNDNDQPRCPGETSDATPSGAALIVGNSTYQCRDANGDGYGDIAVVAPTSNVGTAIANTGPQSAGAVWTYYGNPDKRFERGANVSDQFANGATVFNTNSPTCLNFTMFNGENDSSPTFEPKLTDMRNCRPTVIRPPSLSPNMALGRYLESSGWGVARASIARGDLTSDGLDDLVIGAPLDSTVATNSGSVIAYTSMRGVGLTPNFMKFYDAVGNSFNYLGASIGIGNFDGDTFEFAPTKFRPKNDIVAGSPNEESYRVTGGGTKLFLTGGFSMPSVKATSEVMLVDNLASLQDYEYDQTKIVGDVNADGYDDAISHVMSYNDKGQTIYDAVLFFGSPYGLVTTTFCKNKKSLVFKTGVGTDADCFPARNRTSQVAKSDVNLPQLLLRPSSVTPQWAQFGYGVGDVNKDGFDDVLLVDPYGADSSDMVPSSQVLLYFGTRGGLQDIVNPSWTPAINDPQIVTTFFELSQSWARDVPEDALAAPFYNWVQYGDFNKDGFADLVLQNPQTRGPNVPDAAGQSLIGEQNPVTRIPIPGQSLPTGMKWFCDQVATNNSSCMSNAGPEYHGAVFIFYGSTSGYWTPKKIGGSRPGAPRTTDDLNFVNDAWTKNIYESENLPANKACSSSGICVPTIIRNPVFLNFEYGYSRLEHMFGASAAVLDLNKDGFDDLVVGSPKFEQLSCHKTGELKDSGRAFVYYGSADGLKASKREDYFLPVYGNNSNNCLLDAASDVGTGLQDGKPIVRAISPTVYDFMSDIGTASTTNLTLRHFGMRMVAAGDVNNDGYEELLVTSPFEDTLDAFKLRTNGTGAGYLYYGPLCSLDNITAVMNTVQRYDKLNKQVKFTDIPEASGASTTACPTKVLAPQKFTMKGAQTTERLSLSITGGRSKQADVNLDGFDDVVFGSYLWNDPVSGSQNVGRGVVFFGSAEGLFTDEFPGTAVETTNGKVKPYFLTPRVSIEDIRFFRGGITSGDVNGDKSMDVLVPSRNYDGDDANPAVDLGAFFLFN